MDHRRKSKEKNTVPNKYVLSLATTRMILSRPAGPLTNFNVGALELGVFSIMAPNLRAFRVMFVRADVCHVFCGGTEVFRLHFPTLVRTAML
jgi:hypothetical protein